MPRQHHKSSKPSTSAAGSSGNTSSTSGSVAIQELFHSANEVQRQLTCAVDGDLNQKHLQEALQNTQELVGKLKTEVKRLLAKVADLELSQNSSVKKSAENELHMEITKLGGSFQFLFSPFQNPKFDPFSSDHPKPTFGPFALVRYANPLNTALGPIAEVYAHIDKKFHSYMIDGDEFGDVFFQAASNARSSAVERLKSAASSIFDFGVEKNLCLKDPKTTKERMANPRVRAHLGLDLPLEYQVVPPLLYLDGDTADIGKLFLNPLLMKMARIVLYGPSMAEKSNASLKTNSPYHRRAKVTPGVIAWCSIVARYLLSSDTELSSSGIGFHSNYDYPGDFENYKMMIILSQNDNRTWYRKLMHTWTKVLFPGGKDKGCGGNASEEDPAVRSGIIGTTAVTDLMERMKIAGSNTMSDSESSESDSEDDSEVVHQHKPRPSASESTDAEDSDSNSEHTIPRAPLPPSQRPRPQLRLTTKTPMVSDDDPHIISYASYASTSMPLPPQPPQPQPQPQWPSTTKTPTVIDDNSHFISYATSLPPPPRPPMARLSTQNLRTDNNVPRIATPHLEVSPPRLDSEPLRQAQNVFDLPNSPLSELGDMQPMISLTQPTTAQAQNSKVGKKPKARAPSQKQQVPGPARRSGRSKSGLNATQKEGDEAIVDKTQKGKGRSRK